MLTVRPSDAEAHGRCNYEYYMRVFEKVTTEEEAANLAFGTCVHTATTGAVLAIANNERYDAVEVFAREWDSALASRKMVFPCGFDPDSMGEVGRELCKQFPEAWEKEKLTPIIVPGRGYMVEQRLQVQIEALVGGVRRAVLLSGQADLVCLDEDGEVVLPDIKTPRTIAFPGFADLADQLTCYQILWDTYADHWHLPRVGRVGFFEGVKSKTTPGWHSQYGRRRSDATVEEMRRKLLAIQRDVEEQWFPKRSGMAFDSPCRLCQLQNWCTNSSDEGLVWPNRNGNQILTGTKIAA